MSRYITRRAIVVFVGLLLLMCLPFIATAMGSPYYTNLATRFLIYGLAAVSLDLVIGYGAMISFGHAMFFGLGGYVVGIIAFHTSEFVPILGWDGTNHALIVWPLAIIFSALLGLLTGVLALRTKGVQFIMITLAFGQMVYFILVSLQYYGGDDGLMIFDRNTIPGLDLADDKVFYYVCLSVLVIWTACCVRFTNSRFGMVLQALSQSERRAINLGVAPMPYRLITFMISAAGTGLAGALWANYAGLVTPDMASWGKSGELMAIVILGGVGTLFGPIAGAVVFLGLEQILTSVTEHWLLFMGPVLVLVVLFNQRGLFGRLLEQRHER